MEKILSYKLSILEFAAFFAVSIAIVGMTVTDVLADHIVALTFFRFIYEPAFQISACLSENPHQPGFTWWMLAIFIENYVIWILLRLLFRIASGHVRGYS